MLPVPSDDVGEIRIDVYKTSLVKSRKGKEKMCEPSELSTLKMHVRDVGAVSLSVSCQDHDHSLRNS